MLNAVVINLDALLHIASDEIFTFVPHGEEKTYLFNATQIRRHCVNNPLDVMHGTVPVTEQMREQITNHGGVEITKVLRLLARPDIYNQPVIFLEWPDGTHVMCDGNHRFVVKTEFCGATELKAYIVPMSVWEKYVLPSELEALLG